MKAPFGADPWVFSRLMRGTPRINGELERVSKARRELAAYFVSQIRAFQPHGPYVVAGYCAGGAIAFELGRQLPELRVGDRLEIHQDQLPALEEQWSRLQGVVLHSEQFLLYRVFDALTDSFFPVLAEMDDEIDDLETQVLAQGIAVGPELPLFRNPDEFYSLDLDLHYLPPGDYVIETYGAHGAHQPLDRFPFTVK